MFYTGYDLYHSDNVILIFIFDFILITCTFRKYNHLLKTVTNQPVANPIFIHQNQIILKKNVHSSKQLKDKYQRSEL